MWFPTVLIVLGTIFASADSKTREEVCQAKLAAGVDGVYACDPENDYGFIVCLGSSIYAHSCGGHPEKLKWNEEDGACSRQGKCSESAASDDTAKQPAPEPDTGITEVVTTAAPPAPVATTAAPPAPVATTAAPPAPPAPVRQHCYRVYDKYYRKAMWASAKVICQAQGGHLAVIPDLLTQNDIRDRFGMDADDFWVGASQRGWIGDWRWVTGQPMLFTNWKPGQPGGRNDDCLSLKRSASGLASWVAADCGKIKPFLCESKICRPMPRVIG